MISINKLSKSYKDKSGSQQVFKNLSYEFESNGVYSILGSSGSGKTTFLKCLAGLEMINSGSVKLNGKILNGKNQFVTPQKRNIGFVDGQVVSENDHCFIEEFFTQCPDDVSLDGFFQTEKYFDHISDQIRADFTFKKGYLEPCKEYIESLDKPPIFLHVRQADNIGREQYHPILPISYFEECLKEFPEDSPCFVFTDDLELSLIHI